jgi:hypothetical protein
MAVAEMRAAATALIDVGGKEAALHAVELNRAARIADSWRKELMKTHRSINKHGARIVEVRE